MTKRNEEMNTNIDELNNPIVGFLLTLQSIRDDVKAALEELHEDGKTLRKDEQAKWTLSAWKGAQDTLTTAHEELDELYATVLTSAPESVQEEIGTGEDIDTSPEGIQAQQARIRECLEQLAPGAARLACEAVCAAADVMLRTHLEMAAQTFEATVHTAEQARDTALQAAALVYQDTCMQALEARGAGESKPNGSKKRTLQ